MPGGRGQASRSSADDGVLIGRLGRPHGTRGEIRAVPTGPTLAHLALGDEVLARSGAGGVHGLVLTGRRGDGASMILAFRGVTSRDGAAALTGAELRVPGERLPAPPSPETVYVRDLIGCRVYLGPRLLGEVVRVHAGPANDALEVAAEGGPVLLPFTADAVREMDVGGGRIVVRPDILDGGAG